MSTSKHVRVEFIQSISTDLGSFAGKQIEVIPEHVAKPWIDQKICKLHSDQSNLPKIVEVPAVVEKAKDDPVANAPTVSPANPKPTGLKKPAPVRK